MNRIHTALLALLILAVALTGGVSANDVDPQDVDFIKTAWTSEVGAGGNPQAWASAGVVSLVDHDFLARGVEVVPPSGASQTGAFVGTIDGADYRFVAGDGSPGATCAIALVAAINPGC